MTADNSYNAYTECSPVPYSYMYNTYLQYYIIICKHTTIESFIRKGAAEKQRL